MSTSEPFSFDSGEMSQLHFGDSLRNPQTAEVSKPVSEISAAPYLPPPVHPRRLYDEETKPTRRKPRFWAPLLAWIALCVGAAFVYEWWHFRRVPARVEPPPAAAKSADRLAPRPTVPPVVPPPATPAEPAPGEVGQQPPAPPHPPRHTEPNYPQAEVAVAPVVIHRVQPGISDGIRSRIRGRVVVPIEVRINASGRVTSAAAEDRGDAVYQYLSGRAAGAARLWRFQPARTRRGRRVASAKTIYFVFTRR
ncbi:MAG: energy transducer TonB [Acidobacteriia bacterium]|nr:energy transducer TonB [Terriglobia bacterium]